MDGSIAIESTTTLALVASAVVGNEADHPDEGTPAPLANSPSALDQAVEDGETAAVGGGFKLAWNLDGIESAGSPAPLAASQARLEWAALGESLEPTSPGALWRRLGESNARGWRPAMVVASRDNTCPERVDFLDSTAISDGDEPIPPLDDPAPGADLIVPDDVGLDSSPEADTPEWFEPVACQIDQWLADAQTPTASRDSSHEVGTERAQSPLACGSAAPGICDGPLGGEQITRSEAARKGPTPALPWPVFSAIEAVAEPATEVAQASTVPWPVFAPAARDVGPEPDTAAITVGPEQITVFARPASAGPLCEPSPRTIAVESTRPTGELPFGPSESAPRHRPLSRPGRKRFG